MLRYTIATGVSETNILTEYGVHISGSTGLLGRPDFKNQTKFDWPYLHGEWIDLRQRRYKSREIKLKCWVKATSEQNAINKMNDFMKAFDTNQLIRLHIDFVEHGGSSAPVYQGTKGLFYLVYLSKHDQPKYKWSNSKQIITFEITLTEPSPVKRIYEISGTDSGTVTIAYTSTSEFDVHWGDGSVTYDCIGSGDLEHAVGSHQFIIVTGVISDISAMELRVSTSELTINTIYSEI